MVSRWPLNSEEMMDEEEARHVRAAYAALLAGKGVPPAVLEQLDNLARLNMRMVDLAGGWWVDIPCGLVRQMRAMEDRINAEISESDILTYLHCAFGCDIDGPRPFPDGELWYDCEPDSARLSRRLAAATSAFSPPGSFANGQDVPFAQAIADFLALIPPPPPSIPPGNEKRLE
jgi:hypothetical protein